MGIQLEYVSTETKILQIDFWKRDRLMEDYSRYVMEAIGKGMEYILRLKVDC